LILKIIKELNSISSDMVGNEISLKVERRVLAKRRWRGQAEDGTDFGFDLIAPLKHGIYFHFEDEKNYVIDQKPEEVFRVPYPNQKEAAHRAWQVGNLHFPAQFKDAYLLVEGDLAVRLMLDRNQIPYEEAIEVFQPVLAASGHHHGSGKLLKYFNMW
jgi:urease accessory protein